MKNCRNSQEEKESDPEASVKDESGSETAPVKVCKHQAMLQEEEERPHYNPHQGEHFFHVHAHMQTHSQGIGIVAVFSSENGKNGVLDC